MYEQYEKAEIIYIVLEGELEVTRVQKDVTYNNENKDQNKSYISPDHQGRSINKQETNSHKQ